VELYLQLGHNMMSLCKDLLQQWGHGTVVLSPRDLKKDQLFRFTQEISSLHGQTLLDPQFYDPRADHKRLVKHSYWPDDYSTAFLGNPEFVQNLLHVIGTYNTQLGTKAYIVPGLYCERVEDDWCAVQESVLTAAAALFPDQRRLATLCLSAETVRFEEQVEILLARAEDWDVDGYYVVAEHPNNRYLVEDPLWLANLLILCSGLKLQGREVIVGYSGHQMLCLAAANVDAIASGAWLNVRSFSMGRFAQTTSETTKRRAVWYYCPQSLSEYKTLFLDIASRAGLLQQLRADSTLGSGYADVLFSGAMPSSTGYGETQSFKHYLQCLHEQVQSARRSSFQETLNAQQLMLETADQFTELFQNSGVRGQDRDFRDMIDVNLAALDVLRDARGFALSREWS